MVRQRIKRIVAVALALAAPACCNGDPDRPRAVETQGQQYLLCGRVVDGSDEETTKVGAVTLRRRGHVVERVGERDGEARLGVVAGIEEWNEPNRANLDALAQWFAAEGVEAIVVAGGLGANREGCLAALEHLGKAKVPVLPLIGASEDFRGYRTAVAQARKRSVPVVDLAHARRVEWDGVDIVSLPGYHNPFYLGHRRGGCAYRAEDVNALGDVLDDAGQPVLLVSASPPRGRGGRAVDWARGGVNIGDPRLTKLIAGRAGALPYGVFGHVYEAGGNATSDVDGRAPVAQDVWSKTLYLNPGAAESVPYDLAGGARSRGMGAVIEIGAQGARYRLHRVARLAPVPPPAARPAVEAGQPAGGEVAPTEVTDEGETPPG